MRTVAMLPSVILYHKILFPQVKRRISKSVDSIHRSIYHSDLLYLHASASTAIQRNKRGSVCIT